MAKIDGVKKYHQRSDETDKNNTFLHNLDLVNNLWIEKQYNINKVKLQQ